MTQTILRIRILTAATLRLVVVPAAEIAAR
jgi:hypothetical protein